MTTETLECTHEKCRCSIAAPLDPVTGDPVETFCGTYCRTASADEEEYMCACGHPGCDAS
jgi:hypothetical protein